MLNETTLRAIAEPQYGYFTTQQAIEAGYTSSLQAYRVKSGHWQKTDWALYRFAGYPDTIESMYTKWSLWFIGCKNKKAVISHESALFFYKLTDIQPSDVHLTIPPKQRGKTEKSGCIFHYQEFSENEISSLSGFCITTPKRTLEDMKPTLVFEACWLNTVRFALEKELISIETACELLGEVLYRQMLATESSWVTPACAINSANVRAGALRDLQRRNDMSNGYGRLRMGRGERQEWRVPNRSFTLVEMLVVIVIICTLAGLLMPSLTRARDSGNIVACANNMRQNGCGVAQYAENFHGFCPYQPGSGWKSYFGDTGCYYRVSSFINYANDCLNASIKLDQSGVFYVVDSNTSVLRCPARYGEVSLPSAPTALMVSRNVQLRTSSSYTFPNFSLLNWEDTYCGPNGAIRLSSVSRSTGQFAGYAKYLIADKCMAVNDEGGDSQDNHRTGGNYLYGDGHAEWIPYGDSILSSTVTSFNLGGTGGMVYYPVNSLFPDRSYSVTGLIRGFWIDKNGAFSADSGLKAYFR